MASDLPPQNVTINNTNQGGGTNIGIQNIFNAAAKPRQVTATQAEALKKLAQGTPRLKIFFTIDTAVPDAAEYGIALSRALALAGFDIDPNAALMTFVPPQLDIGVRPNSKGDEAAANGLLAMLKSAGIKTSPPSSGIEMGSTPNSWGDTPRPGVQLIIGLPSR